MATIDITKFDGLLPKFNVGLKPDNCGTIAFNCNLADGRLRPMKQAVSLLNKIPIVNADYDDVGEDIVPRTLLYVRRINGDVIYWWHGEVEIAPAPVEITEDVRFVVSGFETDQSYAYMAAGSFGGSTNNNLKMGRFWKPPLPAPVVSYPNPQGRDRTTRWRQSWVDGMGYESELSEASEEFDYNNNEPVLIEETPAPTGAVARRLYKIVAGLNEGEDDYAFVFEQKTFQNVFPSIVKIVSDNDVGETAPDVTHPPLELGGIVAMPGNFFAGFNIENKREIMFSDVGLIYSYPLEYRHSTGDENVVRLVSMGNSLVALTNDKPLFFSGASPESMIMTPTSTHAPLISRRGVTKIGNVCLFASDDGIYSVQFGGETQGAVNQTAQWFDRIAWRKLNPESCFFAAFNNVLYAWFPDAEDPKMRNHKYVFGEGLSTLTTHDESAVAVVTIPDKGVVALRVGG